MHLQDEIGNVESEVSMTRCSCLYEKKIRVMICKGVIQKMKKRSILWALIVMFGIGTSLFFLVGFGLGVSDVLSPGSIPFAEKPTVSVPETQTNNDKEAYHVISLGDSLTRGTGDDSGSGYVRRAIAQLEKSQDKPVQLLNNLAINGLRADQLVKSLDSESMGYSLKQANVIMLTIGGNDLFQSALGGQNANEALDLAALKAKAMTGISSLKQVLTKLREWNPDALIIYVGLYNPFADLKEMHKIGNAVVEEWNSAAAEWINQDDNMILIPTQDLFEFNISTYLSTDHFHPNGTGYEAIATRIVQSIPR